jgi:glutamine synthetase
LMMTVMKATARKHGFLCLLHEKPFAGINGSGKHVNWSVGNSTQGNLLDPGSTPSQNLNFLVFCGAVIRGVHKYGPLLRAVIASAGNDHRLGANEAPPAILSVYLGDQLEQVFEDIKAGRVTVDADSGSMDLGLAPILTFDRDPGDRNRTSPFAFTGNRFEFRAVGSNHSVSGPLVAMNTMLADSLHWIADKLEAVLPENATQKQLGIAVAGVLQELMESHSNVIFGGDGYSPEWHRAAVEDRGLRNIPTTADALPVLIEPEILELFERTNVLSPAEMHSRYEVYAEQYILAIAVEANLMVEMAKTIILPAAMTSLGSLTTTSEQAKQFGVELDTTPITTLARLSNALRAAVDELSGAMGKHEFESTEAHMKFCADTVRGLMDDVRTHADALEGEIADADWPLPKYREMLFLR